MTAANPARRPVPRLLNIDAGCGIYLDHDRALGGWYLEAWADFGRDHRISTQRWTHDADAVSAFEQNTHTWLTVDGEDLTPFETGTMRVRVPATFFDDHRSRGLPVGEIESESQRYAFVWVTPAELAEWRSDAAHYAAWTGPDYRDNFAICNSAKRALVALPERFEAQR